NALAAGIYLGWDRERVPHACSSCRSAEHFASREGDPPQVGHPRCYSELHHDKHMAQWTNDLILLLALFAAIWYALETRKMRLQMIRPKLIFHTPPHNPAH